MWAQMESTVRTRTGSAYVASNYVIAAAGVRVHSGSRRHSEDIQISFPESSTMDEIARGPNFIYAREWIQKEYGEAAWERILAAMPPEAAAVWNKRILAGSLYSFSAFKAVLPAMAREVGGQTDRDLARMYAYIADCSLNQIYKVFFRVTNPSFVIRNYPKLWSRFFTEGTVEVPSAEKERARLVFTIPEIFLDWLPSACLGFSGKAIEMAKGSQLQQKQMEKSQLGNGMWRVTYDLTWSEA